MNSGVTRAEEVAGISKELIYLGLMGGRDHWSRGGGGALSLCSLQMRLQEVSCGDGEMAGAAGALTALTEDLCSVPSPLTVAYNHLKLSFQGL